MEKPYSSFVGQKCLAQQFFSPNSLKLLVLELLFLFCWPQNNFELLGEHFVGPNSFGPTKEVKVYCDYVHSMSDWEFFSNHWNKKSHYLAACPMNWYKEGPADGGICKRCPDNSHTVTMAATNEKHCICDRGYHGNPGGPCAGIFRKKIQKYQELKNLHGS